MAGLKEIETVLGDPSLKLKKISDTRWLSHEASVTAVRKCHASLIVSLERETSERNDQMAKSLVNTQPYFLLTLAMFSNVLPHQNGLSLFFQRKAIASQ